MEVILVQDVDHLGKAGEKIKVRDGYSRNYLLPNRLAVPVSESGLRFLEAKKKKAEEKRHKDKEEANQVGGRLASWTCQIQRRAGAEGKLFGSVTRQDIFTELEKAGFQVDKRKIELPGAIHSVGDYQIELRLHPEVVTKFKLTVTAL